MSFFGELKRRNVLRVAAAYALVSWILIEAGSVLLPTFGAPEWFFRVYVVIVMAGFVVSMIIAWVFEITPDGVRRESDIDRASYDAPKRAYLNTALIVLLVVALGVSVTFNLTGLRDRDEAPAAGMRDRTLAVLPFGSLSIDSQNRFFADGIHADLLTRLSETGSFRVTSGTSVAAYAGSSKNARQIGEELGVNYIVEGAVQRSGDQARIMVKLIDTRSDSPVWTRNFDRELTVANVFSIQSEISMEVAAALNAQLGPGSESRVARIPTSNVEAYAQYVQARRNLYLRRFDTLQLAREQFEKAIELDPRYAQAWAGLAETVMVLLTNHNALPESEAVAVATAAVETALDYDPDLAEAHAVSGLIELRRWQVTRTGRGDQLAEAAFQRAILLNPSLANAHVWYSSLREAQADYEGAVDLLTRALEIDPLGRIPYVNLPGMLEAQGDAEGAVSIWLKAVAIFPDWPMPIQYLAEHLERLGRLDEAVAWHLRARAMSDDMMSGRYLVGIYHVFGQDERTLEWISQFPEGHPIHTLAQGFLQFTQGDYRASLASLATIEGSENVPREIVYPLMTVAAIHVGDYDRAHELIVRGFPSLAADVSSGVDRFNLGPALLYAYLQQQRDQPLLAQRVLDDAEAVVRDMPRLGRSGHGIRDVQILALEGRPEAALDRLQDAVDAGFVSLMAFDPWDLDQDPLTESLRGHPRYGRLLQRMAERIDVMRSRVDDAQQTGNWDALRAVIDAP